MPAASSDASDATMPKRSGASAETTAPTGEGVMLKDGSAPGSYTGVLSFPEGGRWDVVVHFTVDGMTRDATFPLNVTRRTPNWAVLGGFAAINVIAIGGAALARRRRPSAA